jgi:hypothetical protein
VISEQLGHLLLDNNLLSLEYLLSIFGQTEAQVDKEASIFVGQQFLLIHPDPMFARLNVHFQAFSENGMEGERHPRQILLLTLTVVNVNDKQSNILRILIIERFDVWQKVYQRSQP